MNFDISIEDSLGHIEIGSFEESFEIATEYFNENDYLSQWESALIDITSGKKEIVTLMTWMFPKNI